ncbi:MAG: DUF481 domain-containing protein [Planctomycetota bacterium]|jgi:putative salt-induced outer membrane protein YdiY
MNRRISLVLVCLLVAVSAAGADEIHLKNGDRLTGKIENVTDGKLTFKSDLAGTITVPIANLRTFSSTEVLHIYLQDGTVINQTAVAGDEGRFGIEQGPALQAQQFDLAAIASINPPPNPVPKWHGDIAVGYTSTHGNTRTDTGTASFNMAKRTEKDRTKISADYAKGEQEDPDTKETETTEHWWRFKGKYDYFFSEKFFGFFDGRYEKDAIAELDRRVIMGLGGGYQWIESDITNFSTEFGLASLWEKFDNQTESNSEISFQLGYNFDRQLTNRLKFMHDLTYYPSIEQVSDYYLTSTSELRANFTQTLFTSFKVIFNYDTTPAIGSGSTDTKYIWGVGGSF